MAYEDYYKSELKSLLEHNKELLVSAYKEWCEATDSEDDWYYMGQFPEFVGDLSGDEIFDSALYRFWFGRDLDGAENTPANPMREYFRYDAYGNIETTDFPEIEIERYIDEIVEYFMENPDEYDYLDKFYQLLMEYNNNEK